MPGRDGKHGPKLPSSPDCLTEQGAVVIAQESIESTAWTNQAKKP